jgi:SEC-C motif-containing protein
MPPTKQLRAQSPCPCGNPKSLGDCCLPYIEGKLLAATAETLMRSRYTAHVIVAVDYLWDTWSPEERGGSSKQDIHAWASSCEWLGLRILETQTGQLKDSQDLVSFIALFRQNGELREHHETSVFKKTQQGWLYVSHKAE